MKSKTNKVISPEYYQSDDVVQLARSLLGKELHTFLDNQRTSGLIVEVEAYCGASDRACHAYRNKLTPRTRTMFKKGGICYVYLVYGMHHLFNIVTNIEGNADAVLVRAIEPNTGLEIMKERRGINADNKLLTGGPARVTQALGITTGNNETDLTGNKIWLTNGRTYNKSEIVASTRIGVEYAGPDALLPWRFYIRGNKYVSK